MAVVALGYTYADGTQYVASDHMENLYSLTSGDSIFGELNGGLTTANFDAGFEILAEHIIPGHGKKSHADDATKPLVIVDNMLSSESEDDSAFMSIPGCGMKFYVAQDRPFALFTWQVFCHAYNFVSHFTSSITSKDVVFMTFFDGAPLYHTRTRMPYTTFTNHNGVYTDDIYSNEAQGAMNFVQSHGEANITTGWHTIEVRIWLERTRTNSEAYKFFRGSNYGSILATAVTAGTSVAAGGFNTDAAALALGYSGGYNHEIFNRLTIGVRNVIAVLY